MVKYFDLLFQAIEKADKVINERPDQRIEHTYTVQMVEQHSVAFQEAIRDLLLELGPEQSARFMELLNERLTDLKPGGNGGSNSSGGGSSGSHSLEKHNHDVDRMIDKGKIIESELEEIQ